jgi:PIN domain nuclease of toxin-antitoxin system
MKILLDTHAFIWWSNEPEKLSKTALDYCQDVGNTLILSVVSVWEMQIKIQLGKLKLNDPLSELIESQRRTNNLEILPVELAHALALERLLNYHKDPFDRLLIVQSQLEDLYLMSKDPIFTSYGAKIIW